MAEPVLAEDVLVNFIVGDERLMAVAKGIAANIHQIQSETERLSITGYFTKLGGELLRVGTIMEAFMPAKLLEDAFEASNKILNTVKGIGASAMLTSDQFTNMQHGITQAAMETGRTFGEMAEAARDLYGSTGLKEGLGSTLVDAERLGQVFDVAGTSFAKLTASMVQLSGGLVKADDVMMSFDKTTGITGKRMEDMLETLTGVAKVMRNALGGGTQFSAAMKGMIPFATNLSAKFTEMGGDGAVLDELLRGVMDPNRWAEIQAKMPTLNMAALQQAASAGNWTAFSQTLQQGAQATANMGRDMPAIARAASGIDFTSAETLAHIDTGALVSGLSQTNTVMDRSAKLARGVSEEWHKLTNTLVGGLLPVVNVVMEGISGALSLINRLTAQMNNVVRGFISWTIVGAGLYGTFMLLRKAAVPMIKAVEDTVVAAGQAVGRAGGSVIQGFMEQVAKSAGAATRLLAVGGAFLLFASSVYVLSEAMNTLGKVDMGKAAVGLGIIGISMAAFAAGAALLTPFAPEIAIVGGALLIFAGAVWIMAEAMQVGAVGLTMMAGGLGAIAAVNLVGAAEGIAVLVPALIALVGVGAVMSTVGLAATVGLYAFGGALASFGAFGNQAFLFAVSVRQITSLRRDLDSLKNVDTSGIVRIGEAMRSLGDINMPKMNGGTDGVSGVMAMIRGFADNFIQFAAMGSTLAKIINGENVYQSVQRGIVVAVSLMTFAVEQVNAAKIPAISEKIFSSMKGVLDLLMSFTTSFIDLGAMGMVLNAQIGGSRVLESIDAGINGAIGMIDNAVQYINAAKITPVSEAVVGTIKGVMGILSDFTKIFIDVGAMGMVFQQTASKAGSLEGSIQNAIRIIFGSGGLIQRMVEGVKGQKVDAAAVGDLAGSLRAMDTMVDPLINLTSLGSVFKSGGDKNLFAFAETLAKFMGGMHGAASVVTDADLSTLTGVAGKLAELRNGFQDEVSLKAQTGADIALSDYTAATRQHQQNVERLLEEISSKIGGLQTSNSKGSDQIAATRNVPSFRPENLFADVEETF